MASGDAGIIVWIGVPVNSPDRGRTLRRRPAGRIRRAAKGAPDAAGPAAGTRRSRSGGRCGGPSLKTLDRRVGAGAAARRGSSSRHARRRRRASSSVGADSGSPRPLPRGPSGASGRGEERDAVVDPVDVAPPATGRRWPALRSVLLSTASRTAIGAERASSLDDAGRRVDRSSVRSDTPAACPRRTARPAAASAGRSPSRPPRTTCSKAATSRRASVPSGKSSSGRSPIVGFQIASGTMRRRGSGHGRVTGTPSGRCWSTTREAGRRPRARPRRRSSSAMSAGNTGIGRPRSSTVGSTPRRRHRRSRRVVAHAFGVLGLAGQPPAPRPRERLQVVRIVHGRRQPRP